MAYQAEYALQALLRIPDDESRLRCVLRHTLTIGKGVVSLVSAVKGLDFGKLAEAYTHFKEVGKGISAGIEGFNAAKTAISAAGESIAAATKAVKVDEVLGTIDQLRDEYKDIKKGTEKCGNWYDELRFAELLLEANNVVAFEQFIKQSSSRIEAGFALGVVRLLKDVIINHEDFSVQFSALHLLAQCFIAGKTFEGQGIVVKTKDKLASLSRHTFFGRLIDESNFWGQYQYLQIEILRVIYEIATNSDDTFKTLQVEAQTLLLHIQQTEDEAQQHLVKREIPEIRLWTPHPKPKIRASTELMELALKTQKRRVEKKLDVIDKKLDRLSALDRLDTGVETLKLQDRCIEIKLAAIDQKLDTLDISEQVKILLEKQRANVLTDENTTKELALYIASLGKHHLQDENTFDLETKVHTFLKSDAKVLLLLGSSGAGKTLFARYLEREYWRIYEPGGHIPLFIPLISVDNPNKNLVEQMLQKKGFSPAHILYLKNQSDFLFLIDGYDEIRGRDNLIMRNELLEWRAKIIISCRTEYLAYPSRSQFIPYVHERPQVTALQECTVAPFAPTQIKAYLEKYVVTYQSPWPAKHYEIYLNKFPNLRTLVEESPFMLFIMASSLPSIVARYTEEPDFSQLTRAALYEAFIQQWFERQVAKLTKQEGRLELLGSNPESVLRTYSQNLAKAMWNAKLSFVEFKPTESIAASSGGYLNPFAAVKAIGSAAQRLAGYQPGWDYFFKDDPRTLAIRLASPIVKIGDYRYRFIHDSILEYLAAFEQFTEDSRRIRRSRYAPMPVLEVKEEILTTGQKSDPNKVEVKEKEIIVHCRVLPVDLNLNAKLLNDTPDIIRFHADFAKDNPEYQQSLWKLIEGSKQNANVIAAANAITILSTAKISFAQHRDLRGIRIPGAILSHGIYDNVDFTGADLSNVNLAGAWLRNVKFTAANMIGVKFDELPSIALKHHARKCAFSLDGQQFAVAEVFNVAIYDAGTWERVGELEGHKSWVDCLAYDPHHPNCLASGDSDGIIYVWNVVTSKILRTLFSGNKLGIVSLAYDSHHPNRLASGGRDRCIRVWDVKEGQIFKQWFLKSDSEWRGHVECLAYDPHHRDHLVSGDNDGNVRVWNMSSAELLCMTIAESSVNCLSYDPHQPNYVAAGYHDGSIRVWDLTTAKVLYVLCEPAATCSVNCLAYDPHQPNSLASGHDDQNVRVWNVSETKTIHIFTGHTYRILCLAYHPLQANRLVSGGDETVRLWDLTQFKVLRTRIGHMNRIECLAYDPHNPNRLASGSVDNIVLVWDMTLSKVLYNLSEHKCWFWARAGMYLAYDPRNKNRLASSCLNQTDRIVWDVAAAKTLKILRPGIERSDECHALAYDPHQPNRLAVGNYKGSVEIWDVDKARVIQRLITDADIFPVGCLAYDPHQPNRLATSGRENENLCIRVWDLNTTKTVHTLFGHTGQLNCLVYDPHRKNRLASGGCDKSVQVWDIVEEKPLLSVIGHTDAVCCLAYDPLRTDCLASGSWDHSVRLWNLKNVSFLLSLAFPQSVAALVWNQVAFCVASGQNIYCFETVRGESSLSFQLRWLVGMPTLWLSGANIQDVQGLDSLNCKLLKQRGAVGDPVETKEDNEAGAVSLSLPLSSSRWRSSSHLFALPSSHMLSQEDLARIEVTKLDPPTEPLLEEVYVGSQL